MVALFHHRSLEALPHCQPHRFHHGYRERYHQLYDHAHGRRRHELRRCAEGSPGKGLCGSRSHGRCRRPDAAAKIAILASIAFNSRVTMDQVFTEGIRRISPVDLAMAHEMGYAVKLLAHAYRSDAGIDVRVHPTMIPESHQLAMVNGVFNAIYTVGDAAGENMFFGEGAGAGPAASAVMGDVLEVARHLQMGIKPLLDARAPTSCQSFPLRTFIRSTTSVLWLPIAVVFWLLRQTSSPSTMFRSRRLLSAAMLHEMTSIWYLLLTRPKNAMCARPSTISWLWRALLRADSRQLSVYRTNRRSYGWFGPDPLPLKFERARVERVPFLRCRESRLDSWFGLASSLYFGMSSKS